MKTIVVRIFCLAGLALAIAFRTVRVSIFACIHDLRNWNVQPQSARLSSPAITNQPKSIERPTQITVPIRSAQLDADAAVDI